VFCPGVQDYVNLINAKGGIDGYKIRINELDNNYQVPPAIEEYWSQAGAAITFVKDKLGGNLKGKKIAYLYYDNPAGTEPLPILKELQQNEGGYLSGGEQQMLAIGRALVSEPKVILLDEPSLGLAPLIVENIFNIIRRLKEERGQTVLLVEQNAALALDLADHGYVMENGRIVLQGPAASLRENPEIKEFYLGLNEVGARRSYRDARQHRRRRAIA
jgi:translation initiation factor RLI1